MALSQYLVAFTLSKDVFMMGLKLDFNSEAVFERKKEVAAVSSPRKIVSPSVMVICLIAFTKMGAAVAEASSAARFILRMKSSANWFKPTLLRVLSTLAASGGMRILRAAFLKNPSGLARFAQPFSAPTRKASLRPLAISSELKPVLVAPEVISVAFLSMPWKDWALAFREISVKSSSSFFIQLKLRLFLIYHYL